MTQNGRQAQQMLMAALELLQRESWEGNLQMTKQCWA